MLKKRALNILLLLECFLAVAILLVVGIFMSGAFFQENNQSSGNVAIGGAVEFDVLAGGNPWNEVYTATPQNLLPGDDLVLPTTLSPKNNTPSLVRAKFTFTLKDGEGNNVTKKTTEQLAQMSSEQQAYYQNVNEFYDYYSQSENLNINNSYFVQSSDGYYYCKYVLSATSAPLTGSAIKLHMPTSIHLSGHSVEVSLVVQSCQANGFNQEMATSIGWNWATIPAATKLAISEHNA